MTVIRDVLGYLESWFLKGCYRGPKDIATDFRAASAPS